MSSNLESLVPFAPGLVLAGTLLAVLALGLIERGGRVAELVGFAGTLIALGLVFAARGHAPALLFQGMIASDGVASFFQVLILLATVLALPLALRSTEIPPGDRNELIVLLLASSFGAMLLVAATDLVMIYLAFELVSLLSYVLACFQRSHRASAEAGLKYVIYGGVASGLMIYGFSLLYGLAGSTGIAQIHDAVRAGGSGVAAAAVVACALALVGFGYKIASAPFHMWAPDVYEGAPTPVTAYFSVVPKVAGFGALVRFFYLGFADAGAAGWQPLTGVGWVPLLELMCVVTMTVGNLAALSQRKVKRMLAYSGIAHAGYVLIGVVTLTPRGLEAAGVYLFVYAFMNLGAFAVVSAVVDRTGSDELESFRGLFWSGPQGAFVAIAAAVFLFALVGAPPTAGFTGKLLLFGAAVEQQRYGIAVAGLLNTLLSVYFYFKVLQAMFLTAPESPSRVAWRRGPLLLIALLIVPTLGLGIRAEPLLAMARASLRLVGV
ncbi:MAG: NADH-quinone oxidoreductase subunit N [bacterium]